MKRSGAPSYNFNLHVDPAAWQPFKPPRPYEESSIRQTLPSTSFIQSDNFQSSQDPSAEVSCTIDPTKPFRRFVVVYARVSTRKHKRWEDDGILTVQNKSLLVENVENGRKRIAASYQNNKDELENLGPGHQIRISGFDVELQEEVFEQKITEYAILCTASELQNLLLERVKEMITLTEEETFDFLNCLYYHPAVLQLRLLQIQQQNPKFLPAPRILEYYPPGYDLSSCYVNESGKLKTLFQLVTKLNLNSEKAIVVASSVTALDMIETMFNSTHFEVYRLDGRTASVKEYQIKNFNATNTKSNLPDKVLLMSSNTPYCGISVSTAKNMILFDVEASSDDKSMKDRVWKNTDKNGDYEIYRLITTDTFEEEAFRIESDERKSSITVVNSDDLEREFNKEEEEEEDLNKTIA